MENGTKVEIGTVDGVRFTGIIQHDNEKFPEFLTLTEVWLERPESIAIFKKVTFINTKNISYITNA